MSTVFNESFVNGNVIDAQHIKQVLDPVQDLEEGQAFYRDDIGSANAYRVNFDGTGSGNKNAISAYKKGQLVVFKAVNANTGAATLQIVGPAGNLAAVPLVKAGNTALSSNDIQANQMVAAVYNDAGGGRFEMLGSSPASSGSGSGSSALPVGSVMPFGGSAAPAGWLFCFGQNVSRTTYAALFSQLGTAFGAGDGSTTFGIPDLRGRVVAGEDDMGGAAAGRLSNSGTGNPGIDGSARGAAGGADRHTLTIGQMPSHNHRHDYSTFATNFGSQVGDTWRGGSLPYYGYNTGGGEAHPNCQPTLVLPYIIYAGV